MNAFKPPLQPFPPRSDEDAIVCAEASAEALRVLRVWQARCAELIRRIQEMSVSHAAEIADLRRLNEALRSELSQLRCHRAGLIPRGYEPPFAPPPQTTAKKPVPATPKASQVQQ
jgi:hypothetical protein